MEQTIQQISILDPKKEKIKYFLISDFIVTNYNHNNDDEEEEDYITIIITIVIIIKYYKILNDISVHHYLLLAIMPL